MASDILSTVHDLPQAFDAKAEILYKEIRALAATRRENDNILSAGQFLKQAYVRIYGTSDALQLSPSPVSFLEAAATAMRRYAVDRARFCRRNPRETDIDNPEFGERIADPDSETGMDILELDHALTKFCSVDPAAARLVQLRYFAGLSLAECAAVLDSNANEVKMLWSYSRAWLMLEFLSSRQLKRESASRYLLHITDHSLN